MQPPLQTHVQYVKGVGPAFAQKLANIGLFTVKDILYHFPFRYIDRRSILPIVETPVGKERTVVGEIVTCGIAFLGKKRSRIFEVVVSDGRGIVSAKWFHFHPKYMTTQYKKGKRVLFAGELTEFGGQKQFVHPEVEFLGEDDASELSGRLLPIYPLTEGVSQRTFRKVLKSAFEKYFGAVEDIYSPEFKKEHNLAGLAESVSYLHYPPKEADIELLNSRRTLAHRTIIFTEFFLLELGLAIKRANNQKEEGIAFKISEADHSLFEKNLPFELTSAQKRSIKEIFLDMSRGSPMNRLLQGDVGSGKTIVALSACLQVIKNGYQATIMAPTEILAEQHYKNISLITEKLKIPSALLTSSVKGEERESIYSGVEKGSIPLLIGTHAVIQKDVKFNKLGLAVIDEQHRFGVLQRQAIHKKGNNPDILVMTATPIPRTLSMTLYGDLEVSILDELPKGRKPIITKIYKENEREKLYNGIKIELERGHQAYVVYPLIEESEKVDLKNATEMSKQLAEIFAPKFKVELLHGRMKQEEKEKIMTAFKAGEINILTATSVVEVGVDVPNATVMVIEHAERFGLAQLHQLRGRVGRSSIQSFCVLVTGGRLSEEGYRRLNIMAETNDGFKISEEDLKIRGPGEFLGVRQSGLPEFKLADLILDALVLQKARQSAFQVITEDPEFALPQNKGFKAAVDGFGKVELGKVA